MNKREKLFMDKIIKRIKVKSKKEKTVIKIVLTRGVVINEKQYDILFYNSKNGFCKSFKISRNKLVYEEPNTNNCTLYERLKRPISEYDFFFIIEQIVYIAQILEKNGLSRNNLVLDLKYIFFNESTKELSFIYLPVATPHGGSGILPLVKQVIYSSQPIESDSKYLSNFSYFIKRYNEFEADKVEAYIYNVNSNIVNIIKMMDLEKGDSINHTASQSTQRRTEILDDEATDIMVDDEKTDLIDEDDEKTDLFDSNEMTDLFPNNVRINSFEKRNDNVDDENTYLLDEEATELFSDDDKTDLFDETQATFYKTPTLTRTLTEEVIRIDKPVFRIGKEENCVDYVVSNNIAISRSHADIISRNGKYFVFDLRSKNKSYINNRVLPAEHEVEIFDGDVLRLANEDFLFQV